MHRCLIAALVAACSPVSAAETLAGPYHAEILRVIDGDTVEAKVHIWLGTDVVTLVRIRDIDAPELHGHCPGEPEAAVAAREYLIELLVGGSVRLAKIGHDKYGRRVDAIMVLPDGRDIGRAMLDSGHAKGMGVRRVKWC